ncbi:MAG: ribosome biogenesis GTPase Der [Fusobacteria bacterium]|nr:ribosome biogenesis GTPase Der [Fusobacteriota bacterium]
MKPIVAIVGRPNVGKSTLFNKLVGDRISIVKDEPGVTRDRLYRETEWLGKEFVLVDTGGLEPNTKDFIMSKVKSQAEVAINEADIIVFVVDVKQGITLLDDEVANVLRKTKKTVILAVNKVDNFDEEQHDIYEFYGLGFHSIVPISAEHTKNIGDLLDEIVEEFDSLENEYEDEGLKIAVIGRPNVGKSSLVNRIVGEERTIVSDIAGTTRDAIDTKFEYNGNKFTIIDTAGIRRKSKVEEDLEYYSVLRSIKAIKRADVCFLLLDPNEGITEQDKRIAGIAHEEKKPVIITINKWDLVDKNEHTPHSYEKVARTFIQFLNYAPFEFISALEGTRVLNLIDKAVKMFEEYNKEVTTGVLNHVFREAILLNPPPTRKGRALKLNYITQISSAPPKFALFVNDVEIVHFSYLRYIENKLREAFGFYGSPVDIEIRQK